MDNKICALIPARGGSKRIPHKNILDFFGKPMVVYTIEAAKDSGLFEEIYVSTEDQEIKKTCLPYCKVIDRNPELATDQATISEVCLDFIKKQGILSGSICILMPNCPLRDSKDINSSYQKFKQSGSSVLMSVFDYGMFYPFWALTKKEKGYGLFFNDKYLIKSQNLPEVYCPSGAIRWIDIKKFLIQKTHHPEDLAIYKLPWYKAIDIDKFEDLTNAKMVKLFLTEHPDFFNEKNDF